MTHTFRDKDIDEIFVITDPPNNTLIHISYLGPTEKPVHLLEYLVKTYTQKGDSVLDFTMGSGSTGVACNNLNRDFTGIELDKTYFNIAKERIEGVK